MGEYFLLFIFVLVLSGLTVWTVRAMKMLGKACYQAILPSSKGNLRDHINRAREEHLPTLSHELNHVPTPWGWEKMPERKTIAVPRATLAKTAVPVPWGWPGNSRTQISQPLDLLSLFHLANGSQKAGGHAAPAMIGTRVEHLGLHALEIYSSSTGALSVVPLGQVPVRDARTPWGW